MLTHSATTARPVGALKHKLFVTGFTFFQGLKLSLSVVQKEAPNFYRIGPCSVHEVFFYFHRETFCTSCAQYMLLTINANILPTDGSYVTVLCRLVGPFIDDVDECPKCIAVFPSTTSHAIFQVII